HGSGLTKRPGGAPAPADESRLPQQGPPLPVGLFRPLPPYEELPRPLSPSGASALIDEGKEAVVDTRSPVLDSEAEPGFAVMRGLALHKLLQMLPGFPEDERQAAALAYLSRAGADWPEAERNKALASVMAILGDSRFAGLFSPSSRAEVAVMGSLEVKGRLRSISGKIDRLAVTPGRVSIVDYKTNRPAPARLAQVPPAYILQLALYRALLQPLYPGRAVTAALLFTEAPRLIELPAQAMDDALARLTGA
ncbi:PD-(D/E)XK nuclease family protein, partial [Mesorhizobium sp. M0317]|uniref:PD-(D/E)XK nuclease family protein n=1 Tax=Mesorhizobium sp. M0317 TaxID=2956935 RepID=UPI00333A70ED